MKEIKLQGIDINGIEKEYSLNDFKGQKVILYFYPKDNTSEKRDIVLIETVFSC